MFRKKKIPYYEPDKGPLWKWVVVFGLVCALCPIAWFLGLFVEKQRARDISFVPLNALDW